MDDKILYLDAQVLSNREVVDTFQELYGEDISASLVSKVTDAVIEQVVEWQARPLDAIYSIVYLDCIVHMVRNSIKFVPWKDYKPVTQDLKQIYQSATEEEALLALECFAERWDDKYHQISKSWRNHWENLNTLFNYPPDIRKAIYTTNAVVP